jgi:hypothetical protein
MVGKKVKIIVYAGMNIGVFIWAAAYCLESASFSRGIIVLVSSLVLINVLMWSSFRARSRKAGDGNV